MELKTYLANKRAVIDEALKFYLPKPEKPAGRLFEAMNYSLFAGGKRLRPILCIASSDAVGGSEKDVLPVACALEMIHTYSLIHDDLPAMDNDDMRRGKPTSHKVYGEALAVLAGDALLTEAFNLISRLDLKGEKRGEVIRKIVALIASAAGPNGMVGGQAVDMLIAGKQVDASVIEFMHAHKTGALITASVSSGAILGGASKNQLESLNRYGSKIGLAFQVSDDILDIEGDSKEMGKIVGVDVQMCKNTYPSVYGLKKSKEILRELVDDAIGSLDQFDIRADPLRRIAEYIIERKK
jgi:geranylgeranyl diphosphate synthase type II